jgi:hypothetical protein
LSSTTPAETSRGVEKTFICDALEQLAHWTKVAYMTGRIHSAPGYLTPAEFEAVLVNNQPDSLLMYD